MMRKMVKKLTELNFFLSNLNQCNLNIDFLLSRKRISNDTTCKYIGVPDLGSVRPLWIL